MKTQYKHELEKINKLNASPQVLAKAIPTIKNPEVEVEDVVEILRADAGLMAEVIRLSNSAYYGCEGEAADLGEAINRIGFRELLRLVGVCVSSGLCRKYKHVNPLPPMSWEHTVATAVLMEKLAIKTGVDPSDAYVIGLLHQVGLLVMGQILSRFPTLVNSYQPGQDFEEWQRKELGFDHFEAAGLVLERWHFPDTVFQPVLRQSEGIADDDAPESEEVGNLYVLLYVSRLLIEDCGMDLKGDIEDLDAYADAIEKLGISQNELIDVLENSRETFEEMRTSFSRTAA